MDVRVHHITIEIEPSVLAEEKLFWGLIGFGETNALSRNRPKVHWLINLRAGLAIHLHPRLDAVVPEYGHIALVCPDITRTRGSLESFGFPVERAAEFFGAERAYTRSPSGHHVELMKSSPSLVAGMPTEEVT